MQSIDCVWAYHAWYTVSELQWVSTDYTFTSPTLQDINERCKLRMFVFAQNNGKNLWIYGIHTV